MFDNLEQEERTLIRCIREANISPYGILLTLYHHNRVLLSAFTREINSTTYRYYEKQLETIEQYIHIADKVKYGEYEEKPIQPFVPWKED